MFSFRIYFGKSEGVVFWRVFSFCCICIIVFNVWGLDSKVCIFGFCSCLNIGIYNS